MKPMYCLAFPLLLLASGSVAQPAGHPCASEVDREARLACYDRAFPPSPEVHEAARERAEAGFGLAAAKDPSRKGGRLDEDDPDRIQSRVTRVDNPGSSQRTFRLENGQAWTQTDARSAGLVRAGDTVEVRKGLMGGYLLVMPNGIAVRVRRTR